MEWASDETCPARGPENGSFFGWEGGVGREGMWEVAEEGERNVEK